MNDEKKVYIEKMEIPSLGQKIVHRDSMEKYEKICHNVGLATRHIGYSVSGKSKKVFVYVADEKKHRLALEKNCVVEKENDAIFEERKTDLHTLEGIFCGGAKE